jgi:Ion channel
MVLSILMAVLAVMLIAASLQDAFEVMLLPRRVQRRVRFAAAYFQVMWPAWRKLVQQLPPGRREGLLSHFGPLSMIGLFVSWTATLIFGYGLLEYVLQPAAGEPGGGSPLAEQVYMSGATFFTLGFGDVVPHTGIARLLTVLEAGTGLGFIAAAISYLPVLYQLFARREAHVLQLDSRAGSPPSAVTMLCRHAEAGGLDKLDDLLREWEMWGADLLESHLSYPMLAYYRSQHDNQSWLAAVAVMLDCCALILVGVRDLPPLQARMTFSMCRQIVVQMAHSFHIAPSRYAGDSRLPTEAYNLMLTAFQNARLEWEGGPGGEGTLHALRATYEPLLDGLGRHLLLLLPQWLPETEAADHWEYGHRGLLARRLVEQLTDRTQPKAGQNGESRLWREVRRRLRVE